MTLAVSLAAVGALWALWRIGTGMKLQAAASSRLASVMERDLELRYRNITPAPDDVGQAGAGTGSDECPDYPPDP